MVEKTSRGGYWLFSVYRRSIYTGLTDISVFFHATRGHRCNLLLGTFMDPESKSVFKGELMEEAFVRGS